VTKTPEQDDPALTRPDDSVLRTRQRLVLSSALMLFLELALIRWLAGNIVHLGYFSNFVLLGSFLGVGLGFLRWRPGRPSPYYFILALALLVVGVLKFPVTVNRTGDELVFFTSLQTSGPPAWLVLPIVFCAVAIVMAGPGELVAACFARLPRLEAYRLDLIGSLLGIAAFTGLSFLRAPSFVWGLGVGLLSILLLAPRYRIVVSLAATAMVVALVFESLASGISWSPYYKIHTETDGITTRVDVNGVPHQSVSNTQAKVDGDPQYLVPYQRIGSNPLRNVLIVGAGTGTDVALALSKGAQHVDAVEIDPRIYQIGQQVNPDHPYDDPRVSVHINDGRAFLERTTSTYDLIIFALPDSLTLVSGASQVRLESYLFTEQAFESVRDHLRPGGAFAMYNYYRENWLVGRLANTAAQAFGHDPCIDLLSAVRAVIVAGLTPADQHCGTGPDVTTRAALPGPAPATDDHPFLYLRDRGIPQLYLYALGLILLVSVLAVRVVAGPLRRMRSYADLFFLGAGFLLLETKAIAGFALLFGTTWVVNAIVFAGVLVAVLSAVEITRRFRTPPIRVMYVLLAASLALAYLVPTHFLLSQSLVPRLILSAVLAFLPIACANIVFAKRFADTADATTAFGANLLGAMLGGCLEYCALIVGYPALLIVAAGLYLVAFALLPRGSRVLTPVG
jgi:SAM-dependent methyltransferase